MIIQEIGNRKCNDASDNVLYVYDDSTHLETKIFFSNISNLIKSDIVNSQDVINNAENNLYKEYATDIYNSIEFTLIYSEIADIVELTYNIGKNNIVNKRKNVEIAVVEMIL